MIEKISQAQAPITLAIATALAVALPTPSTVAVLIVAVLNYQASKAWAYLEVKEQKRTSEPGVAKPLAKNKMGEARATNQNIRATR